MRKLRALVGDIVFLEEARDGEFAALVYLDQCQEIEVEDDSDAIEALLHKGEAYLIPEQYSGSIRYL